MSVNYHLRRRNKSFLRRKVSEALPEYYGGEFPTLINFLEEFQTFLQEEL